MAVADMPEAKLEIKLQPSKIFVAGLLFAHLGAIICLSYLALNKWLLIGLAIIITSSLAYFFYTKVLLLGAKTIVKIKLITTANCLLSNNAGNELKAELCQESFVSNFLVILNCKIPQKKLKVAVVILVDSIAPEILRQLRVLLFNELNVSAESSRL
jgi:hypothetical protein